MSRTKDINKQLYLSFIQGQRKRTQTSNGFNKLLTYRKERIGNFKKQVFLPFFLCWTALSDRITWNCWFADMILLPAKPWADTRNSHNVSTSCRKVFIVLNNGIIYVFERCKSGFPVLFFKQNIQSIFDALGK